MKTFDDDINHEGGNQGADQDHEREREAKRQAKGREYWELFPQGENFYLVDRWNFFMCSL